MFFDNGSRRGRTPYRFSIKHITEGLGNKEVESSTVGYQPGKEQRYNVFKHHQLIKIERGWF